MKFSNVKCEIWMAVVGHRKNLTIRRGDCLKMKCKIKCTDKKRKRRTFTWSPSFNLMLSVFMAGVFFFIVRFTDQKFMTEPQWQLKMMSPNILWRNNNLGATVLAVYHRKRKSMNRKGMSVWMTKLLSWVVTYILRIKERLPSC